MLPIVLPMKFDFIRTKVREGRRNGGPRLSSCVCAASYVIHEYNSVRLITFVYSRFGFLPNIAPRGEKEKERCY